MKSFAILVFGLIFMSCTVINNNTRIPRDSFVYIHQSAEYVICDTTPGQPKECRDATPTWHASGVLIAKDEEENKSYILTASHVCDFPDSSLHRIITSRKNEVIFGYTLEGEKHAAKVIAQDDDYDLCLMEIEYVKNKVSVIGTSEPIPGDRIYNAAAPASVWNPNMVILLEGYYSGKRGFNTLMTIPAALGSSGSPVFNKEGEIISMIHSVNTKFNNISIGTRLLFIRRFLKENLPGFE